MDEGQVGGFESLSLTNSTMPLHNHANTVTGLTVAGTMKAFSTAGNTDAANAGYMASLADLYVAPASADLKMAAQTVTGNMQSGLTVAGGGQPFSNRSPYLGINFIICVEGIFPSRN